MGFDDVMLFVFGVMTGIFLSILGYHDDWVKIIFMVVAIASSWAAMPYLYRWRVARRAARSSDREL